MRHGRILHLLAMLPVFGLPPGTAADDARDPAGLLRVRSSFARENAAPITNECIGFVTETDGFLLTSYLPLVDSATGRLSGDINAIVRLEDGVVEIPAKIIAVEPTLNFAVLKVDHHAAIPAFALNTIRRLSNGEVVLAYRLSEAGRFAPIHGIFREMNKIECYQEDLTGAMLKTDIALTDASIGSPIIDGEGRVFGIYSVNEPEEEHESDGVPEVHLLPMSLAMNIYGSLKQRHSLESPWTGFSVRAVTEGEGSRFPLLKGRVRCGIALEYIWKGGPAEAWGIRKDDILFKFSHYPVCSVADFQKWLYLYGVGEPATLYFVRDGKELIKFDYVIEERPAWAKPR